MKRGDVVISSAPGDYGKPRPALVVQSDLFNPTHASIVVCPVTTHLVDAPLFRLPLKPSAANGLKAESQIMVDKVMAVRRDKIGKRIGAITPEELARVDSALRTWLDLDPSG
jgi:mRNA interferase MazF